MLKYKRKIGKIFTPKTIKLILSQDIREIKKLYKELKKFQIISEQKSIETFFDACYQILLNSYRNEYVFKNSMIQESFFTRELGVMYSELQINDSKLDLAFFGDSSYAFEIKTELDNFERLDHQIENYKKVFEYISVITVENKTKNLLEKLDNNIGVFVLCENGKIENIREPHPHNDTLEKKAFFSLYHQKEYLSLIQKYFPDNIQNIQKIPNTKIYTYALEFFNQLPIETIKKEFLINMKKRKEKYKKTSILLNVPKSLEFLALSYLWNEQKIRIFNKTIKRKI